MTTMGGALPPHPPASREVRSPPPLRGGGGGGLEKIPNSIPASLSVKSVTLLNGTTGVDASDSINIVNDEAVLTVDKDGTTATFTIRIEVATS